MRIRRYERAIADLTEAIKLKPDLALAYCERGFGNFLLGRYDEALADYTKGLRVGSQGVDLLLVDEQAQPGKD